MSWSEETAMALGRWINVQINQAGASGAVFGLSGGIDSAVVGSLCVRAVGPENCLALIMPCHSDPRDTEDGLLMAEYLGVPHRQIDLSSTFDHLYALFQGHPYEGEKSIPSANIKPRLRMITLYYHAAERGCLVVGTGNKSELQVGYFTKFGDGGVDLLPLGNLLKTQVRELAEWLGIPRPIIEKVPSAGLWKAQSDEAEMGLTYGELDHYLATGDASPDISAKVETMRRLSEHKRRLPLLPPDF